MTRPEFAAAPIEGQGPGTLSECVPSIRVLGARTHNLRQVTVDIPLGQFTVITGVSGSGKSSLAFDTIFAEGRYRYLSSVSLRSQELLQSIERPDVDFIDGLPPVLCIEQKLKGIRQRSTVATISEIYDFLRLLFARVGQLYCPTCHVPVATQSRSMIVDQILGLENRQKVIILAPVVRGRAGAHHEVFAKIVKDGFVRARVDGEIIDATSPPEINSSLPHDIEIVVDRLIVKDGIQSRLEESIELALQLGHGMCVLSRDIDGFWQDRLYSSRLTCLNCGTAFPSLELRSFSFHSAIGACQTCQGLGIVVAADETETRCPACQGTRLGPIPRAVLIDGTSISDFCSMTPTQAAQTVDRWSTFFSSSLDQNDRETSFVSRTTTQHILPEIVSRLRFLIDIGLDYLTLDRSGDTLSTGELQRTRIAACLGNQLTGVCYILDEPTAGLHSRDTHRLIQTLNRLRDDGNTVVLVEHDLEVMRQADHLIDLGPGAGILGGHVLATGTPDELAKNPASITGRFLAAKDERSLAHSGKSITVSDTPLIDDASTTSLRLTGATLNNLKNVTIAIPLQKIVCVTGVSGSGKSSLVMQTLVPAIRRALGERIAAGGPFHNLSGVEALSKLVQVDQSPLGRSARSCPATYSGLWDHVRQILAKTKESRLRGYGPRNFSLAVADARCPRCAGRGVLPVDGQRFSDWTVRCPDCDGRRFAPATLSVRYRGQTAADILEMSLEEADRFFENFSRIARTLSIFNELGLGYLKFGQSATTLSGGEAQRIKLGTELAKSTGENMATLFVLDEPTSGLHPADIAHLAKVFRRLVSDGHSVVVIEHNKELISCADWIVEVGPGAGIDGGNIVLAGKPHDSAILNQT